MRPRSRAFAAAWAAWFLVTPSWASRAEFSVKDAQVLGRTLGFVGDGMTGVAVIGVAFASNSPASRREADAVRAVVGDELSTGRVKLRARLVPLDQLATVEGIDALFVTSGLVTSTGVIADAARRLGGVVAAAAAGLPLTEAGTGPGVADGLTPLSPEWLARRLEQGWSAPQEVSS